MTSHEHWTRPETERWQIEKLHECFDPNTHHETTTEWGRIVWHANKPTQTLDQCLYYASSHRYIMATQHILTGTLPREELWRTISLQKNDMKRAGNSVHWKIALNFWWRTWMLNRIPKSFVRLTY